MKKQAMNPYMGGAEHVPDGEPHVFGDRVYVYGSHDCFGGDDFCMLDYVGWSAPVEDLADWRYEGVIYRAKQDPFYTPERRLFAPDVAVGADGRYYLYYGFDHTGTLAVAVCDSPVGQYEFYGHITWADGTLLGEGAEDMFQYDPAVLVDDDGRVYLYSGFCFNADKIAKFRHLKSNRRGAMVIELEADMKTVKRSPEHFIPCEFNAAGSSFEGHAFFEASSIRKFGDTYYFVYSSENSHELCYATSQKPDRDFTYAGIIISNGDIGYMGNSEPLNYTGTNHGGLVEIKGRYYIFWHRQSGGSAYARQGCAEEVFFDERGHIPQVCTSSCGLNGGPLAGKGIYPAGIACCLMSGQGAEPYRPKTRIGEEHPYFTHDGEDFEITGEEEQPLQYITNMRDGAVCGFRYFDLRESKVLEATVRDLELDGKTAEGSLLVRDSREGSLIAELKLQGSGCIRADLMSHAAQTELWITYSGTGAIDLLTIAFL